MCDGFLILNSRKKEHKRRTVRPVKSELGY